MRRIRLIAVGCGGRARRYVELASRQPDKFAIVAAADPLPHRVKRIRALSNNPAFRACSSDKDLFREGKIADVAIIGTQDAYHVEPCLRAMELGYDILLEKPIAPTMEGVEAVLSKAEQLGRKVMVCHVLRYTPFYRKVKEIVDSGKLGTIITVNAREGVGPWHHCHSFVRGHWSVTETASPMILAKSCHDLDMLQWIIGEPCRAVSSFGHLSWFHPGNKPEGAPERCTDGCPVENTCPYHAKRYCSEQRPWLGHVMDDADDASDGKIIEWLKVSPWGRCVYRCENTAVDHQVVNLQFDRNITATFTMTAFDNGRTLEIFGTKGRLLGGESLKRQSGHDLIIEQHDSEEVIHQDLMESTHSGGHMGGDEGLVDALYDEMVNKPISGMETSIQNSVLSHRMAFAAEQSRLSGRVVRL